MFLLFLLASTAFGGCDVTERKTCKGKAQTLDFFDREFAQSIPAYSKGGKRMQEWCQKMCEYYGVEGCCAWDVIDALDVNNAECYFVAGGSPVTDNTESKTVVSFGYPVEYAIKPLKYGGKCTWSGKQKMIPDNRKTGCDYDGVDKEGRRALGGPSHTEDECKKFCMDGDCVHASLSSSGYCHTFMTCNWSEISFDHGATMWQKVDSVAPTTYVKELGSCCMEYGKCMTDGYCNASKERCEGRCNRKNGKKTWRDATATVESEVGDESTRTAELYCNFYRDTEANCKAHAQCVWGVDGNGRWGTCVGKSHSALTTQCVDGIVDLGRSSVGKKSFRDCKAAAKRALIPLTQGGGKGTSFVWGNGNFCYLYTQKVVAVLSYSPSAGKGSWKTCTPGSFSTGAAKVDVGWEAMDMEMTEEREEAVARQPNSEIKRASGEEAVARQPNSEIKRASGEEAVARQPNSEIKRASGAFAQSQSGSHVLGPVHVLASVGLAFVLYGAYKHYTKQ